MSGTPYDVRAHQLLKRIATLPQRGFIPPGITWSSDMSRIMAEEDNWAISTTQRVLRRMRDERLLRQVTRPDRTLPTSHRYLALTPLGARRLREMNRQAKTVEDIRAADSVTAPF